jgi:hypothetical protein
VAKFEWAIFADVMSVQCPRGVERNFRDWRAHKTAACGQRKRRNTAEISKKSSSKTSSRTRVNYHSAISTNVKPCVTTEQSCASFYGSEVIFTFTVSEINSRRADGGSLWV